MEIVIKVSDKKNGIECHTTKSGKDVVTYYLTQPQMDEFINQISASWKQ